MGNQACWGEAWLTTDPLVVCLQPCGVLASSGSLRRVLQKIGSAQRGDQTAPSGGDSEGALPAQALARTIWFLSSFEG